MTRAAGTVRPSLRNGAAMPISAAESSRLDVKLDKISAGKPLTARMAATSVISG